MISNVCKIKICVYNQDKKNKHLFGRCSKSQIHIGNDMSCLDFSDKYDMIV